jgi:hypothetical protein
MNCFAWGPNQRISVQPAIPKPPRPLGVQTALPPATVRRVRDLPALQPEHRLHSPNLPNLTSVSRSATWVNLTVTRASRTVCIHPETLTFSHRHYWRSQNLRIGPCSCTCRCLFLCLSIPQQISLSFRSAVEESAFALAVVCSCCHPTPSIRYTGSPCPLHPNP